MSPKTSTRSNDPAARRGRTPAQWFNLVAGIVLMLVGALGFIADATFDSPLLGIGDDIAGGSGDPGQSLQGDGFLGFEVNGWHNVVHLATGTFLLLTSFKRGSAKIGALAFGLTYALVTVIGLIDGNDVVDLIPVNPADNVLHAVLTIAALAAGLLSTGKGDVGLGGDLERGRSKTTSDRDRAHDRDRGEGRERDPRRETDAGETGSPAREARDADVAQNEGRGEHRGRPGQGTTVAGPYGTNHGADAARVEGVGRGDGGPPERR